MRRMNYLRFLVAGFPLPRSKKKASYDHYVLVSDSVISDGGNIELRNS
jgi:hypothetical protein